MESRKLVLIFSSIVMIIMSGFSCSDKDGYKYTCKTVDNDILDTVKKGEIYIEDLHGNMTVTIYVVAYYLTVFDPIVDTSEGNIYIDFNISRKKSHSGTSMKRADVFELKFIFKKKYFPGISPDNIILKDKKKIEPYI